MRIPAMPLLVVALELSGGSLMAQSFSETLLDSAGYGTTIVSNHSPEMVDIVVELRHGWVSGDSIALAQPAVALVSPSQFELAPGESQLIRLLLREPLPSDSVLRLVTTTTPQAARAVGKADDDTATGVRTRIFYATRIITKVRRE